MNAAQMRDVIKKYRAYLSLAGDKAEVANFDLPPTRGEAIRHMLSMCDQMEKFLDDFEKELQDLKMGYGEPGLIPVWDKVNRWIGFMQGVLWDHGSFTLNEMRKHNTQPTGCREETRYCHDPSATPPRSGFCTHCGCTRSQACSPSS